MKFDQKNKKSKLLGCRAKQLRLYTLYYIRRCSTV